MKVEERLALLKQLESVAALAGLKGVISDDGQFFLMGFEVGDGRSQRVFVRPTGSTPDGKTVVTISSPAHLQSKGWFSSFSREDAINLLRLNESTFFARYGIQDAGPISKEMMIVASSDVILETLDAEELRAHAHFVSHAADAYEKKMSKADDF
jgi:hypothetical protein